MLSGALCGLAVMLLWGVADFCQTLASRRIGAPATMLARGALATLIGGVLCLIFSAAAELSANAALVVLGASLAYALGYAAYMRGLEIGVVGLVAPIASSFSVVTVALAVVIDAEGLSAARAAMMALVLSGVALLSAAVGQLRGAAGLREALATLPLFGAAFYIMGRAPGAPDVLALFGWSTLTRGLCFMAVGAASGARPAAVAAGGGRAMALMLGHAALLHLGWLSYIAGARIAALSVVAPLASAYAGVTTLMAATLLRERLRPAQWAGLCLILLGVAGLNR